MWPRKEQFVKKSKSTLNGSAEALAALGRASKAKASKDSSKKKEDK